MNATILFYWFLVLQCVSYVSPRSKWQQTKTQRIQKYRLNDMSQIPLNSFNQCVVVKQGTTKRMRKRWPNGVSRKPLNLLNFNLRNGLQKYCMYVPNGKKLKWAKRSMKQKDNILKRLEHQEQKIYFSALFKELFCIGYCTDEIETIAATKITPTTIATITRKPLTIPPVIYDEDYYIPPAE